MPRSDLKHPSWHTCPRCGAEPGYDCVTASGKRAGGFHAPRLDATRPYELLTHLQWVVEDYTERPEMGAQAALDMVIDALTHKFGERNQVVRWLKTLS